MCRDTGSDSEFIRLLYDNFMIEAKTYPRFKCDFCKKKSVKHVMEKHEKTCYYNPNRVCRDCNNEGVIFFNHIYDTGAVEGEKDCPCVEILEIIKRDKLYA